MAGHVPSAGSGRAAFACRAERKTWSSGRAVRHACCDLHVTHEEATSREHDARQRTEKQCAARLHKCTDAHLA
eukprot:5713450-Pleurochrysis_carterae.AAC.2